jgi:hypothetical protein
MKTGTGTSTAAFVDAIDEGVARLLIGEQAFTLPARLLPAGVGEGAWVEISVGRAPAPPDDTGGAQRRSRLAGDDPGGDVKL